MSFAGSTPWLKFIFGPITFLIPYFASAFSPKIMHLWICPVDQMIGILSPCARPNGHKAAPISYVTTCSNTSKATLLRFSFHKLPNPPTISHLRHTIQLLKGTVQNVFARRIRFISGYMQEKVPSRARAKRISNRCIQIWTILISSSLGSIKSPP